jgi:hypothetical protein
MRCAASGRRALLGGRHGVPVGGAALLVVAAVCCSSPLRCGGVPCPLLVTLTAPV